MTKNLASQFILYCGGTLRIVFIYLFIYSFICLFIYLLTQKACEHVFKCLGKYVALFLIYKLRAKLTQHESKYARKSN